MLKWKEDYSVGIKLIDEQHKQLFEIGNNAYDLLKNDSCLDKYPRILQVIKDLRQYFKYHFKCEEEYMLKINYQNYDIQKIEHDAFIKKIDSLNLEKIDQNQDKYITDLLSILFEWIVNHILHNDKLIKKEELIS